MADFLDQLVEMLLSIIVGVAIWGSIVVLGVGAGWLINLATR